MDAASTSQPAMQGISPHGKRHPADMGEVEIGAFVSCLARERHVSASTQNQALSAVLFLYRDVLGENANADPGDTSRRSDRCACPLCYRATEVDGVAGAASRCAEADGGA